jgi:prophage antirepressor-like protein
MNAAKIIPFQHETHPVRVIADESGEPWFVAKDICNALGYADVSMIVRKLDDDEKGTSPICTPSGQQEMLTVNESGLYSLILTSRKPKAKEFKRWVTHEVLPALRKTGTYTHPDFRPEKTRTAHPGGLTIEQQDAVKALHKDLCAAVTDRAGKARLAVALWSGVKSKFGVSYKDVPAAEFPAVISLMSRIAVEGEYLPAPAAQTPKTMEETIFGEKFEGMRKAAGEYLQGCEEAVKSCGAQLPDWPKIDATDLAHVILRHQLDDARMLVTFGRNGTTSTQMVPKDASVITIDQIPQAMINASAEQVSAILDCCVQKFKWWGGKR